MGLVYMFHLEVRRFCIYASYPLVDRPPVPVRPPGRGEMACSNLPGALAPIKNDLTGIERHRKRRHFEDCTRDSRGAYIRVRSMDCLTYLTGLEL